MIKAHFVHAFAELQEMITDLSARVEDAVYHAIQAATNHDLAAAQSIIAADAVIDELEIRIEEECLKLLALYQPVAGDLRQVITVLKINNELERAGDLAVNIAERIPDMARYHKADIEKFDFADMVKRTCEMLKKALDALAYHNIATATEVIDSDDAVDLLHHDNYGRAREMMIRHPTESGYYMDCLTVSRCLERIADIATNIAEDVIYLESGKIVRHAHDGMNYGK